MKGRDCYEVCSYAAFMMPSRMQPRWWWMAGMGDNFGMRMCTSNGCAATPLEHTQPSSVMPYP